MGHILIEAKLKCKKCGKIFRSRTLRGYCTDACRYPGEGKLIDCTCSKCGQKFLTTRLIKKQCPKCRGAKHQIAPQLLELPLKSNPLPINKENFVKKVFFIPHKKGITDENINNAIKLLSPIEEFVLRARCGEPKATLQNIGLTLGVHRERVRQIEAKAIRKLKRPALLRILIRGEGAGLDNSLERLQQLAKLTEIL